MPNIRGWEWVIILVLVLIIFGVGRLPEVGGALGKAIREFRTQTKSSLEEETSERGEETSEREEDPKNG